MVEITFDNTERDAEILSALSSSKRLKCFDMLYQGTPPKEIAEEIGISRSGIQPYLSDFKDAKLVRIEGKEYVFTDLGENIHEAVGNIDEMHRDLSEVQQFILENPDVIPEEVLEDIERRNPDKS